MKNNNCKDKSNSKRIKSNKNNLRIGRRMVSFLLVGALIFNNTPQIPFSNVFKMSKTVYAANKDNYSDQVYNDEESEVYTYRQEGVYYLSSVERILTYSRAYFSFPGNHYQDTIQIGYVEGDSASAISDFIAIGTEEYPFQGKVILATTAACTLQIPEAFFDYVYDSVEIVGDSDGVTPYSMYFERTTTDSEPVLARHVKHDPDLEGVNEWLVTLNSYNTTNNYSTSGFIGEMMDGAKLQISITDNTTAAVSNSLTGADDVKDAGYVCGSLGAGSELTVKSITGSNTTYSVTSAAGNAGGVVGSMYDGSTLTLCCNMPNSSASVTASGSGGYAGGISGYNDGGTVVLNNDSTLGNVFSNSSKYTVSNTVVGAAGAGGVFGFYKPAFTLNTETNLNEAEFDVAAYQIGTDTNSRMTANGSGSVGGLFGVLENNCSDVSGCITVKDTSDNSAVIYVDHSNGDMINYGGLIGKYTSAQLGNSLLVKDISVNCNRTGGSYTNYGGCIGITGSADTDAAYVKFDGYDVSIANGNNDAANVFGGLVADSNSAFIDSNDITAKSSINFYGGGVIGHMDGGVLRLMGSADLSGTGKVQVSDATVYSEGQIVGYRDNALIFAEKDWRLTRASVSVDDIGSWGEVIHFDNKDSTTTNGITYEQFGSDTVVTVNENAHTATVEAAPIADNKITISSVGDYAKTALNMQINDGQNTGALLFADTDNTSSELLSTNIELGNTTAISLSDTGLGGLTRDNAPTDSITASKCVYSGTVDGKGHEIDLAIGSTNDGGAVYRHFYNGLLGIVNDGSVKNITLGGTVSVNAKRDKAIVYAGAFAGRATGNLSATETVNVNTDFTHYGNTQLLLGRFVGEASEGIGTITVSSATFSGDVSAPTGTNGNGHGDTCLGGVIGLISHNLDETKEWSFTNVTLKGSISDSAAKDSQKIGGLIAAIAGNYSDNTKHRTLTLENVSAEGLNISGVLNSNGAMGGLLGYSWLKTDVNATSVTVKNDGTKASAVDIGTVDGNTAGLVYRATGKWNVDSLDIQNIKMTAGFANSVGMIVNKGYYASAESNYYSEGGRSAIYLLLPSGYTYNLAIDESSAINSSAVFDELCAYTCPGEAYIMNNGNGVISIHNDNFSTNGTNVSGTYHAQTANGAKPNPNARYYYNLDTVTAGSTGLSVFTYNATTNAGAYNNQLMSFALNRYTCTNIKQYFANPLGNTIPNQTYDLTGYSWYPINVDSGLTVNGTFKLYNQEFEISEGLKYTAENTADSTKAYDRTSLYDSENKSNTQHYLMHNALFNDVNSCTLTIGSITLQGDVNAYVNDDDSTSASVCGALICGTVHGSSSSKVGTVKVNTGISLDGIKVNNLSTISDYAPLLINKLGSNSKLDMAKVSTTTSYNSGTSSSFAGTSLIGDAGNSSATNINIEFKSMTLDGRNVTGKSDADLADTSKGNFLAMYNTYNSIFTKATFLNSFSYGASSSGRYDFTWAQDWDVNGDDAADTPHSGKVTYGMELGYDNTNYPKTGAVSPYWNSQYPDEEFKYASSSKYTNPISASDTTHSYWRNAAGTNLFVKNFLPYVAEKYNASSQMYQLQVNHDSKEASGCGTYNDPYIISTGDDIENFCSWINDGATSANIYIPTAGLIKNETDKTITAITGTWCEGKEAHVQCTYDTENSVHKCTINGTVYTFEDDVLRTYLAGAYYKIADDAAANDLVIDNNDFKGFGANDTTDGNDGQYPYRFRGVFDGNGKTIINQTSAPFIYYSYGSVVKDLTISVQPISNITLVGYQKSFDRMCTYVNNSNATGNDAYGGVIARVMGGDNIIDNVSVNYSAMEESGYKFNLPASYAQLVPLGGYVGVVVNGGVYFRNMNDAAVAYNSSGLNNNLIQGTPKIDYKPGNTTLVSKDNNNNSPTTGLLDSKNWLYVNPVIGRVINGFAVTESDAYRPYEDGIRTFGDGAKEYWVKKTVDGSTVWKSSTDSSDKDNAVGVTMKNGTKHYSIADIDASETSGTKKDQIAITSNNVTVSGGQDFFLMSLIVNSGMAKKGLGYNQKYQVSRSAKYTDIGTDGASSTDYNTASSDKLNKDSYTKSDVLGYLANAYVDNSSSTANLANNGSLTITLSADVILPDGYKGMGNIYKNNSGDDKLNDSYLMKVKTFTGNGHKISQNSSFLMYHNSDLEKTYYPVSNDNGSGFGLFNVQQNNSTYKNVILTGNVTTDLINHKASSDNTYYDKDKGYAPYQYTNGNMNKGWLPSTGSLFGVCDAQIELNSVALKNINIFGTEYTGGMIGYHPNNKKITISNTEAGLGSEKIIVRGGLTVGGLIGKKQQGELYFDNANSSKEACSFSITEVASLCVNMDDNGSYYNYGVGGLVGACRGQTNSTTKATLKNFTMGSKDQTTLNYVKCENANIYTGGLFGILNRQYLEMENCTIYNMSVNTKLAAGGIVGHWATSGANKVSAEHTSTINNVSLICNVDNAEISSTGTSDYCSAGGILGSGKQDMAAVTVNNCIVSGYNITGYKFAGGVVGSWGDSSTTGGNEYLEHILTVNNVEVSKSKINSDPSVGNSGGIVGSLNTVKKFFYYLYGYNDLCYNLEFTGKNQGYVCGTNQDTNNDVIKIVGFSKQDNQASSTMILDNIGEGDCGKDKSSKSGYIIFADYTGACLRKNYSERWPVTPDTSAYNIAPASPYVSTAQKTDIDDSQFLTGDSVGYTNNITYANSSIGKILTEASGQTAARRYALAYSNIGEDETADLITKLSTYGKYTSYNKEMGSSAMTSKNFPVLIVDDVLEDECTKFINEYLQYMTNSDFDFSQNNSSVFTVDIGSMVWDESSSEFVYHNGAYSSSNKNGAYLSLSTSNKKFSIDGTHFDNTDGGRFTLIDVQFKDPADSSKIVYHLYVPVLVKKMLQYDFFASTLSGTNYRVAPYETVRANTLIENIGNPVTMEFQWNYHRTLAEWQQAMAAGDNMLMTLKKALKLKLGTNKFPSNTQMALIDANNDNKVYYAATNDMEIANAATADFDLTKFKITEGENTTDFTSMDFNDFFVVTATENSDSKGGFDRVTLGEGVTETKAAYVAAGATVCASDGNYYKVNTSGTGGYDITLAYKEGVYDSETGYINEKYYISFYTDESAPTTDDVGLYHLDFYDPGTFNEPSCPTKSVYNNHTHILTGVIFVNSFEIKENSVNPDSKISVENDHVYATLAAAIGINPTYRAQVRTYLSDTYSTVHVYQSMLVMLDRMDLNGRDKGILSKPVITVSDFTIKHTLNGTEFVDEDDATENMSNVYDLITSNYIELRDNIDLKKLLYNSCSGAYNLDISATVDLAYPDTVSMSAQFPTRDTSQLNNDEIGTIIGASSNISSVATAAAYSNTMKEDWDDTAYYVTINTNAILTLNSDDAGNKYGDFYQLGINELDLEADGLALDNNGNPIVKLNAVYDVSDLSEAGTAECMKLTISLRKKADYNKKLDIDDYINNLALYDKDGNSFKTTGNSSNITVTETADSYEYTYIIKDPDENLKYDSAGQIYEIPIIFSILSGDNFNGQYSNYMIKLEAELYTDDSATSDNLIDGSYDDDHVIWTHTKMVYDVFEH